MHGTPICEDMETVNQKQNFRKPRGSKGTAKLLYNETCDIVSSFSKYSERKWQGHFKGQDVGFTYMQGFSVLVASASTYHSSPVADTICMFCWLSMASGV